MNKTCILAAALCAGVLIPALAALHHAQAAESETALYYLEAEVVDVLDHATVFGQVDGPAPSSITYEAAGVYTADIPYLLTMDSMGTSDPADDEILVVWGCMSGGD